MKESNAPRKSVSHYKIFEYWKDKGILESGDIVLITRPSTEYERVVYDLGEPCRWACDKPILTSREKDDILEINMEKIWNDIRVKKQLNRCHIIPRALGGEDIPSNLFLMCPDCHEQSPDTMNPKVFFRWVYDHRKLPRFYGMMNPSVFTEKVYQSLSRRGIKCDVNELAKVINSEMNSITQIQKDMKLYLKSHIGTHEFKFSETTIVEGLVDWILHKYTEIVLR